MNAGTEHPPRRVFNILTGEGTALPFEVAPLPDRLVALLVDLVLIHLGVVAILVAGAVGTAGFGVHALSVALLSSFLLRNFYFICFEIAWGGATPGKRRMGLRVLSRSGEPLSADALIARNLTREFEVFFPLMVLSAPGAVMPGIPAGLALIGSLWMLVGALLPLFNTERLRLGDLLGGTIVVSVPRSALLEDPAARPAGASAHATAAGPLFTSEQLDQYGIEELQVLEDLLRRADQPGEAEVQVAVVEKIRAKIAWTERVAWADSTAFLSAFYVQLRAHLEHKALFGERQEHKREGRLGGAPESNPDD